MQNATIDAVLCNIVREEVRAALEELRRTEKPTEWVRSRECGLPDATRRRLVRNRVLEQSKVGRDLYVRRVDVEKYFASQIQDEKEIRDASSDYERIVAQSRQRYARIEERDQLNRKLAEARRKRGL